MACSSGSNQLETDLGKHYGAKLATAVVQEDGVNDICSELRDLASWEEDILHGPQQEKTVVAANETQTIGALATVRAGIGLNEPIEVSTPSAQLRELLLIADKTEKAEVREELPDIERLNEVCDNAKSGSSSDAQNDLNELLGTEAE